MEVRVKNNAILFSFVLIIGILALIIQSPIVLLIYSIIVFSIIVRYAGVSFFSILSFLLTYAYMQCVVHKLVRIHVSTLMLAGRTTPYHFNEISIATVSFLITMLWFVLFTKLIKHEKNFYKKGTCISLRTGVIFISIAIIIMLLMFPSHPTLSFGETRSRSGLLFRYYGLVLTSFLLCAMTVDLSFKYKGFNIAYLVILFWIVSHGERVEAVGFMVYFILKYLNYYSALEISQMIRKSVANHKRRRIYILILLGIAILFAIGAIRDKMSISRIGDLIYHVIFLPTCGDVCYVFNCAIDYWKNYGTLNGISYLTYLFEVIPGVSADKFSAGYILSQKYFNMGGGLFYTEPVINFGIIGVVIMNIEFCFAMYLILKRDSVFRVWFWIPFVLCIFRTAYYGRGYWVLCTCVEVPLLYIGTKYVLHGIRRVKNKTTSDLTREANIL